MKVSVFKVSQSNPSDLSGVQSLIDSGELNPQNIVAVLGKTEGNGCVNDFTRGYATQACKQFFSNYLSKEDASKIVYVMSGGTEGIITPHLTLFSIETNQTSEKRKGMVIAVGKTRHFKPSEIGTLSMVKTVAETITNCLNEHSISPKDVHFVQIKCPLTTAERRAKDPDVKTEDSYKSMALSRGASSLGTAVALGELCINDISEDDICSNFNLYSSVASASAGIELENCEIIIMGNSENSQSDFIMSHDVMTHALDAMAVKKAIEKTKLPASSVFTVLTKAEADPSGSILNHRHTMIDDSDISHTRMARAVVGAVVGSITQDPRIYISGGSEHQGPSGGGPVAVISRLKTTSD